MIGKSSFSFYARIFFIVWYFPKLEKKNNTLTLDSIHACFDVCMWSAFLFIYFYSFCFYIIVNRWNVAVDVYVTLQKQLIAVCPVNFLYSVNDTMRFSLSLLHFSRLFFTIFDWYMTNQNLIENQLSLSLSFRLYVINFFSNVVIRWWIIEQIHTIWREMKSSFQYNTTGKYLLFSFQFFSKIIITLYDVMNRKPEHEKKS